MIIKAPSNLTNKEKGEWISRRHWYEIFTPDGQWCDVVDAPDAIPLSDTEYTQRKAPFDPMDYGVTRKR